ncbi:MAG: hypothetical protein WB952_05725 [Terriglobales bacterium]
MKPSGGWKSTSHFKAKLTTSDADFYFISAIAVQGNTIVAGDCGEGGNPGPGAAYVFVKPATGWKSMTESAKLTASDGKPYDCFGHSVAVSHDTVVVGAPTSQEGAAYVFVKPPNGWTNMTETAKLTAFDALVSPGLGTSVAISGGHSRGGF